MVEKHLWCSGPNKVNDPDTIAKSDKSDNRFFFTSGEMVNDQAVALAPAVGMVKVQRLLVSVGDVAGADGLGLVNPLCRDQQSLLEEILFLSGILRFQ